MYRMPAPSVDCVNQRWLFIDTIPAQTEKSYWFNEADAHANQSYIGSRIRNYFQGDRIVLNSCKSLLDIFITMTKKY